jgi:hypothetical protein
MEQNENFCLTVNVYAQYITQLTAAPTSNLLRHRQLRYVWDGQRWEPKIFGSQNDATARLGLWAQAAEDSAR